MRRYETTFILRPALEEEALEAAISKYADLITNPGGNLEHREHLGKRRLAYEIKSEYEGHYVIFRFRASEDILRELERSFRLSDEVLRYLIVRREVDIAPSRPPRQERPPGEIISPEEVAQRAKEKSSPQPPAQEVEGSA